ncbi:MAG: histone deacetylase family protein [Gammaproteobacteria bacterium]|nr:histone deacetylase family protein [Gammaproteobacteria bacterium]
MHTAYITHNDCLLHDTGAVHPECARRLTAINDRLITSTLYDFLQHIDAPEVTDEQLLRVHQQDFINYVFKSIPEEGHHYLDPDTIVSPASGQAAKRAAGAVVKAVDLVMAGDIKNAFCAIRPPGHHAEKDMSMGFCVFNNIAVGAAHAMAVYGLKRIAIIDFDVHHGNGTEDIFVNDERVLMCSVFQHPFYPNTPLLDNDRIISMPLAATAKSKEFRDAINNQCLPALHDFKPEMIFISAGFDAHRDDDMSGVSLEDADYQWITEQILEIAKQYANERIVSSLEGGYEIHSLARCVEKHIRTLMNLHY